ncbi:TPA: sugar porter family MFS transporter [Candidatus Gastranaerophilales bacterium HUM_13]|jgi:MFS transporter, SP family|nr:sugar porter family MFS transporter [Acinetobacter sp.]CCZ51005.1 sugar transporter [Acinetobacter sp. CAG:196]DAA99625.1 MAG TPA: sugar porter family MFS transporter [Candidatus Gastranaerophilales bacterium HUM_10]DAB09287.1 MAG TPA: sugar porter family MFS transporter [Candidatus Gastranaerophilales bacterium HUM_13]DAB09941.1 MAG TPA: sugar porter family MFS transporter [Candidatus Gastranaerophilales bacterium HUM_15]DAB11526.1 MAG TPA: sugar porter family MFS transporter [Candidatus G
MKYIWLYIVAIVASLGGLLSGYDTGVISGALLFINETWVLPDTLQGFLVSSVLIGAVIGAATNGILADIFGRKKIIMATAVIFILGSILCAFAPNVYVLILSRIFVGFAVGIVNFVVPLYLSEVSPKNLRGTLVSLYQWAITAGILFSYFINAVFAQAVYNWRWMLFAGVVPGLVLFIGMCFMSDTPRWLVSKNRDDEAKKVFSKIEPDIEPEKEIAEIKETLVDNRQEKAFRLKKWMIMPFVVGIGIMFAQICTGINTIIYYAPTIFKTAGFDSNLTAIYATTGIGVVNFIMTIVAVFFTDRIGRKPLLYFGLTGVMLSLFALGTSFAFAGVLGSSLKWVAVGSLVTYIICFAMSLGPIGWILVSEVFPLRIRGIAMSVCTVSNFAFNFFVVGSFPVLLHRIGGAWTFWIFGIVSILCIIFVYFFVPETKGISLEEIESNWRRGVNPRDF